MHSVYVYATELVGWERCSLVLLDFVANRTKTLSKIVWQSVAMLNFKSCLWFQVFFRMFSVTYTNRNELYLG